MKAYGIPFVNRIKSDNSQEQRDVNLAEFVAFAALCASYGVAQHVKSVVWDGNVDSFCIDVDDQYEHNDVGGAIGFSADQTLSQFILFGYCYQKRTLEDEQ